MRIAYVLIALFCCCAGRGDTGGMGSSIMQGKVLAADGHRVTIDLGSRDKLRPGDVLFVRKGRHYLGKFYVRQVSEHTTIGDFEMESDTAPRPGDIVYAASHDGAQEHGGGGRAASR